MATKIEPMLDDVMLDVPVNKLDIRVIRDAIDSIIGVVGFARSVIVICSRVCGTSNYSTGIGTNLPGRRHGNQLYLASTSKSPDRVMATQLTDRFQYSSLLHKDYDFLEAQAIRMAKKNDWFDYVTVD